MFRPACWFAYSTLIVIALGACGSEDEPRESEVESPVMMCTTLVNNPCSCPGGGYGVYACDGSCLNCPVMGAGRGGTAGTPATGAAGRGATGFAGRSGGAAGMPTVPPVAGSPGTSPGGAAGMGPAGAPAPAGTGAPAAGSGGMPVGGMMAGAAGGGATTTGDVPASPACMPVSMWSAEWAGFEVEVLRLVNENRAKGWNCDTEGMKPAAPPLTMEPTLRCSARLHSKDMADQMYFAHESLDGRNPGARMTAAGYSGRTWGENIAKGQQSPAQVVAGWMDSDGHCSNIMNATFTLIGVGYFAGMGTNPRFNSELYWTQNFGAAAGGGRPRP